MKHGICYTKPVKCHYMQWTGDNESKVREFLHPSYLMHIDNGNLRLFMEHSATSILFNPGDILLKYDGSGAVFSVTEKTFDSMYVLEKPKCHKK